MLNTAQKKLSSIIILIIIIIVILAGVITFLMRNNRTLQNISKVEEETMIVEEYDKDIFEEKYELAKNKLQTLTLEQKIGQMLIVTYDEKDTANDYGGILFFEKDFRDKNEEQVKEMTENLKNNSNIPILKAVDEEGKTGNRGVTRISSNSKLTSSNNYLNGEEFQNPQTLYKNGGFNLIKTDTIEKSKFLYNLGINLNLAPVADICNAGDYMYYRSVGLDTDGTSKYIQTVTEAGKEAKESGYEVSYCLKHFPGYGSNKDTHKGLSVDTRTIEQVKNDMTSFKTGIDSGIESVLVSHNIVSSIDTDNTPASLSKNINNLLRNDLQFTGIIMTDSLSMGAVDSIENKYKKAVLAGNDMLIVSYGKPAITEIKDAVESTEISIDTIDKAVTRILAWKYYKNMY